MKKKIVIVTKKMIMGGIEKALISLLKNIPRDKFDVTVLVMGYGGELSTQLPNDITVRGVFGDEETTLERIWNYTKKGKFFSALKVGWYTWLVTRTSSGFEQNTYYSQMSIPESEEYDLAIAYHGPVSFPIIYVINHITAKRKVTWVHNDVSFFENDLQRYAGFYERYDSVFCVSHHAAKSFNKVFPNLVAKTSVASNFLEKEKMILLSKEEGGYPDKYDGIRILTVGRLEFEKGYDVIPGVLNKLISAGHNVRWYCIGDGSMREKLVNMVTEYQVEENLFFLGTKVNPYPFIKNCNLYVQPSRHEAYCLTVAEAKFFNKPIITTNTGASEQIIHEKTGLIVHFNEQQLYQAICRVLNDEKLQDRFVKNLSMQVEENKNYIKELLG